MAPPLPDGLLQALRDALGPDGVSVDDDTRRTYSVDASPCYVPPQAVATPRSEDAVVRAIRACSEHGVPLTPRAAGTSLSGAAIGPGVVLDTSRLSDIRELHVSEGWVRVGAGVSILELNAFLRERGYRFPLEPGSREWCRIGGMIGHNASGYQSVKYGQTADHVLGLRVVLATGDIIDVADVDLDGPAWRDLVSRAPAFGSIRHTIEHHRAAILASRRPVRKHACGYGLAAIAESLDRGVFPVARLFLGSEGTLGVVTEARLRVLPLPERTVTLLIHLDRFEDLGPLVADLLPLGPSALEGIDGDSLDVLGRAAHGIPARSRALILAEFDEGPLEALVDRVAHEIAPRYSLSRPVDAAYDPSRQAALWEARRSLFPTLLRRPGSRKPWGFVEDPIVPPPRVPEFIGFLADLARRYGTVAGIYGHLGDGNTHYRPLFDPLDPQDFERMRALREEFDAVLLDRFHGAPSAEHGMGRLRAELLPRVWGPEVAEAMRAVKDALDPKGLFNPGVLFSDAPWWASWGGLEARVPQ